MTCPDWNYNPFNNNEEGDSWNGENFSCTSTSAFCTLPQEMFDVFAGEWGFIRTGSVVLGSVAKVRVFVERVPQSQVDQPQLFSYTDFGDRDATLADASRHDFVTPCPALYDQLDVVTTATEQRLKDKSTTAIHEWAASADLADEDGPGFNDSIPDANPSLQQGDAPLACAELRAMCTQVVAETILVCEQHDALIAENRALKAENSKMKALYEKTMDTKRTKDDDGSSLDREPVQDSDFQAYTFPVLTQLVLDVPQPILRHAEIPRTNRPCKTCTGFRD
ncbi:hypothetical protein B0H14DRAFT_3517387 [Mycena olivaceomarginata]|nr:hypothetical protein B0H14DRAFT_3517387 [Mycena olivaceomarginata]